MKLAISILGIVAGPLLIFLAIFREREKPTCLRIAMGLSGVFATSSGALKLAYLICRDSATKLVVHRLSVSETFFSGIFVGMGLVVLISRNLKIKASEKQTPPL